MSKNITNSRRTVAERITVSDRLRQMRTVGAPLNVYDGKQQWMLASLRY